MNNRNLYLVSILFLFVGIFLGYFLGNKVTTQNFENKLKEKGLMLTNPAVFVEDYDTSRAFSGKVTDKAGSEITVSVSSLNPLNDDQIKKINVSSGTQIVIQKLKDIQLRQQENFAYQQNSDVSSASEPVDHHDVAVPFTEEPASIEQIKTGDCVAVTLDSANKSLVQKITVFSSVVPTVLR